MTHQDTVGTRTQGMSLKLRRNRSLRHMGRIVRSGNEDGNDRKTVSTPIPSFVDVIDFLIQDLGALLIDALEVTEGG